MHSEAAELDRDLSQTDPVRTPLWSDLVVSADDHD